MDIIKIDIDPMNMPLCPICDNGMQMEEGLCVVSAEGAIGLAHTDCASQVLLTDTGD
jgi:hypothetical protein